MAVSGSTETKKLMGQAFKRLVLKKPFTKITIGEIAKESAMTRENFYYHFRDKYDICYWIFKQEVLLKLPGEDKPFETWINTLIHLILKDTVYHKKLIKSMGIDEIRACLYPYFEARIQMLVRDTLDDSVWNMRKEKEAFAVAFFVDAFLSFSLNYILEHEEIDEEDIQVQFKFLFDQFLPFILSEKKAN